MTRCLYTFALSIVLYSFSTFAGTIEVAQWIPWNFVSNEIGKEKLDIVIQESELQMSFSELTPKLQGVKIDIRGELNTLHFSSSGISSRQTFSGKIEIGKILINQMIVREFDGNQIQINLKADCSPLQIIIPKLNTFIESSFVEEANRWQPELNQIGLSIPQNSWNLSPITCTGIGGVGEEISRSLTEALRNPDSFSGVIKNVISVELRKYFGEGWSNLLNATGSELSITRMQKPDENGFLVFADLSIKNKKRVLLPHPDEAILSKLSPQLIISADGFEALLEDKFMAMAPQTFNLQKINAFASLMRSRTKQYFAWPDLRRFPSSTPFYLSTYSDESQLKLGAKSNGKWKANLNANGVLKTAIGGSPIDYIHFGIGVATELTIKVNDGKIQLASGASQLELAWNYGFLYQLIYKPNTRIALDIFKSSLNQFFAHREVEENLPSLNFQNRVWKLQNWAQQNDIITMDWL